MRLSNLLIVSAACAALVCAPSCTRLVRSAARAGRSSPYGQRNQTRPEDLRIEFVDLDAPSVKLLNQHRAKWSDYVQRYNAADTHGAAQVLAVLEGYRNAHWSERPKPEDLVEPLGVAIGDVVKSDGHVTWVLAEEDVVCLCSTNGKVAVAPGDIADTWLSTKTAPMDQLLKDVAKAVRETTGEPVLIGFVEERKFEPQLR